MLKAGPGNFYSQRCRWDLTAVRKMVCWSQDKTLPHRACSWKAFRKVGGNKFFQGKIQNDVLPFFMCRQGFQTRFRCRVVSKRRLHLRFNIFRIIIPRSVFELFIIAFSFWANPQNSTMTSDSAKTGNVISFITTVWNLWLQNSALRCFFFNNPAVSIRR